MKKYTPSASAFVQLVIYGLLLVSPGRQAGVRAQGDAPGAQQAGVGAHEARVGAQRTAAGLGAGARKIRFSLVRDYLVVVPIFVNGCGPFEFILDTGTTTTIMDSRLAATLELKAVDRLTLVTLAGEKAFLRSWLQSASLAGAVAQHVEVVWDDLGDLDNLEAVDPRIRGILGLNFLDGFNYAIDYEHRMIEIEGAGAGGSHFYGARIPNDRVDGKLIVTARTKSRAQPSLRFGLDSGIGSPVVYTSGSRVPACVTGGAEWTDGRASTLTGAINTRMGELGTLDVGGQAISGLTAALMPRIDPASQIEDGVLPTVLFRSIYFNNRDNYVILNPR